MCEPNIKYLKKKKIRAILSLHFFSLLEIMLAVQWKTSVSNAVMKSNAGCNEIESNIVNCRLCLVASEVRKIRWNKSKTW